MNVVTSYTVNDQAIQAHLEYTSKEVAVEFADSFAIFVELFNLKDDDQGSIDSFISQFNLDVAGLPNPPPSSLEEIISDPTLEYILQSRVNNALGDLASLSLGFGRDRLGTTAATGDVLSIEMATAFDQLLKSFAATGSNIESVVTAVRSSVENGWPLISNWVTSGEIIAWKDMSSTSPVIKDLLDLGISAAGSRNRSLQAMVESVYVRTGNELIEETLNGLETSLGITKDALALLNDIQALHNNVVAESKGSFKSAVEAELGAEWTSTGSNKTIIADLASEFFGTNIGVTVSDGALAKSTNAAGETVRVPGVIDPDIYAQFNGLLDQLDRMIFALDTEEITPPL